MNFLIYYSPPPPPPMTLQPNLGLGLFNPPSPSIFPLIPIPSLWLKFRNKYVLRDDVVSSTPHPQPGRPGCPFVSGSSPLTCLEWEATERDRTCIEPMPVQSFTSASNGTKFSHPEHGGVAPRQNVRINSRCPKYKQPTLHIIWTNWKPENVSKYVIKSVTKYDVFT